MAGTNITNLLEIIQRKIDAADGNTATKDLLYLLSAVRKGDGTALELYDSSGAFPDLTDSDADKEMIAYKLDSDRLYFNVGVWKGKQPPPPTLKYRRSLSPLYAIISVSAAESVRSGNAPELSYNSSAEPSP